MVKIKYVGAGMNSRSIKFDPKQNDGLYTVSDEDAEYFLDTFPRQFERIENIQEKKVAPEKKQRAPRAKKKSTDTPEG